MFDIKLRSLKDKISDPIARLIPSFIHPTTLTLAAFCFGLACCASAIYDQPTNSLLYWCLNRAFDCLDGSLARQRNQSSDLGGFLDLLCDFIVYSLIPICCASSSAARSSESNVLWLSVALLEATFHINNFILFYVAAVTEKRKTAGATQQTRKGNATRREEHEEYEACAKQAEVTSLSMHPSLIEGAESAMFFTVMLAKPSWLEVLCWWMAALVSIGILDRTMFLVRKL